MQSRTPSHKIADFHGEGLQTPPALGLVIPPKFFDFQHCTQQLGSRVQGPHSFFNASTAHKHEPLAKENSSRKCHNWDCISPDDLDPQVLSPLCGAVTSLTHSITGQVCASSRSLKSSVLVLHRVPVTCHWNVLATGSHRTKTCLHTPGGHRSLLVMLKHLVSQLRYQEWWRMHACGTKAAHVVCAPTVKQPSHYESNAIIVVPHGHKKITLTD